MIIFKEYLRNKGGEYSKYSSLNVSDAFTLLLYLEILLRVIILFLTEVSLLVKGLKNVVLIVVE